MTENERLVTGTRYVDAFQKLENYEPGTNEHGMMLEEVKILGELMLKDDIQELEHDAKVRQVGYDSEKLEFERQKLIVEKKWSRFQLFGEAGIRLLGFIFEHTKNRMWINANWGWNQNAWLNEGAGYRNPAGYKKDQMLKPPM